MNNFASKVASVVTALVGVSQAAISTPALPDSIEQVSRQYPVLSGEIGTATLDLTITTGYEWSTAEDQLELWVDVVMELNDP